MGEYVRRVKTGSGATAVQIASKTRGVRSIIEHVGSAHTDLELELMVQTAKTRIRERAQAAGQAEFQIDTPAVPVMPRITMHHSYSRLLYDTLAGLYDQLGFDTVNIGPLSESWRVERDRPAYVVRQNADELRANLAIANRLP